MLKFTTPIFLFFLLLNSCKEAPKNEVEEDPVDTSYYNEDYRPQFHFSPEEKWMNDPNGLVYHKGIYHLFYQYYPDDIVWGPMHWGHATSKDMLHWEHKPIALFPDDHGYIFSGSAVVDTNNTSGFGTEENPPLVAIFTYHDMEGEKAGKNDYQTQGIAYSLDNGDSWTKFDGNPIIKNEGIRDFRDPKVFWNAILNNWTMLLVAGDHLQIWQSDNLKAWEKVSEFGKDKGAHGGVWECPDMFKLNVEGTDTEKWVLLISINPGAPNGGSGTQYFVGDFDGTTFTTDQEVTKWVDWGRDNYAGVTYNDTPDNERIFIGWMSNWDYARDTPTEVWRSANTIPRNLSLHKNNGTLELYSYPIANFDEIVERSYAEKPVALKPGQKTQIPLKFGNQSEIRFHLEALDSKWIFSNPEGDSLVLQVNQKDKIFSLDRSKSGKVDFKSEFVNGIQLMPIPNVPEGPIEVRMLLDQSSLEIFLNKGQYVMTNQIFPNADYKELTMENTSDTEIKIDSLMESKVMRIWN
ncbi:glycoside hydrolase family 32 protein [Maribacter algicola]|uniref:Glycoside hydrolase family 32 protein n=1 Tax=Maribacter algicola TaxID=2498892 RepID=A0A426RND5_9FLAO|nr:glycoside hydrolase family 32 protein [Maribacter algicola]RRQ50488.1 glycoside hydrolase family 32 protein [Maribacter algicola]